MNYEQLLNQAYEKVKVTRECCRFEIPRVSGHHEGTKTIITNFAQIASGIRRPQGHLLKFISKELASLGEISGDRIILSRKLASKMINEKIERYVNTFVLCSKCKKPDTELQEEGAKLFLKCLACGERKEVHRI
ncbi:MAG: translation initiation factor IF-2 subunit beta [archaeon]|nr:translation initiation factor IF-2 subunit beta [archaeon]MCR4323674.1 translation initiation factor IF-2 subunit beta [Nanoarchaeota archaeon]